MFDPKAHLIHLPRRVKAPDGRYTTVYGEYLEVKWRLVWFREKYPHGVIATQEVWVDLERGYARFRAVVSDGEGGEATGYGTETAAGFADYVERAETRALGRALAVLGYGTQYVGTDLTEGEHLVDAPVAPGNGQPPPGNGAGEATPAPVTSDEVSALVELAHSVGVDLQAFGHDMRRLLGLTHGTKVTTKRLRERLTRAQYQDAWEAYSARLKQEVEQSLEEDVPDHPPPARVTTGEPSGGSPNGEPVSAVVTPVTPRNGQPEPTPDDRLRWGALSRRALAAGLSPTVWEALRAGDYGHAERLIAGLEAAPVAGVA